MPIFEHSHSETKKVSQRKLSRKLKKLALIKSNFISRRGIERRSVASWCKTNGIPLEAMPHKMEGPVYFSWMADSEVRHGPSPSDCTNRKEIVLFQQAAIIQLIPRRVIQGEMGAVTTYFPRKVSRAEFYSYVRTRAIFGKYVMENLDGVFWRLNRSSALVVQYFESKLGPLAPTQPSTA